MNIFVTALVAVIAGALVFLIGNEAGSYVAAACTGGVFTGAGCASSYILGGMTSEDEGKWNAKRFTYMMVAGILGGLLGGLMFLAKG